MKTLTLTRDDLLKNRANVNIIDVTTMDLKMDIFKLCQEYDVVVFNDKNLQKTLKHRYEKHGVIKEI